MENQLFIMFMQRNDLKRILQVARTVIVESYKEHYTQRPPWFRNSIQKKPTQISVQIAINLNPFAFSKVKSIFQKGKRLLNSKKNGKNRGQSVAIIDPKQLKRHKGKYFIIFAKLVIVLSAYCMHPSRNILIIPLNNKISEMKAP